jgi:hypothetical protein
MKLGISEKISTLFCIIAKAYTLGWVDIGIRITVRLGKVLFVAKV